MIFILLSAHDVPPSVTPTRLSDYAVGRFEAIPSRKGVKKAIKRGAIRVNGEAATTGYWVQPGDRIELYEVESPPRALELLLEVVWEDDDLAVVIKPAGLTVSGNQYRTLENALVYNLQPSSLPDARPWPRPVHRLDALTSGLVLTAKTASAEIALRRQFAERQVGKTYQAVVAGDLPDAGRIEAPLDGKAAVTDYRVLACAYSQRNGRLCRVALHPVTGRTHQLRRHLAGRGNPILGDKLYGEPGNVLKGKGLFLAAVGLDFIHPRSGERIEVKISPPRKFIRYLDRQSGEAMP